MSHRSRPSAHLVSLGRTLAFVALASAFAGCSLLKPNDVAPPQTVAVPTQPDPSAPRLAALQTRQFTLGAGQDLVGEMQVLFARYENTFSAIGREYDLGYEEMRSANPGVDQWLPGEGTPIYLPTQSILPDAARKGIVINVPAMRLYYFTTEKPPGTTEKSADPAAVTTTVTTYPIGIGAEGWATPFGEARSGLVRAGLGTQGAPRARRQAAECRAARTRQSARRVCDDAVDPELPDPRN